MLDGRNGITVERHISSPKHVRYAKTDDGTTLDEFLYKFFTFLVKGIYFLFYQLSD